LVGDELRLVAGKRGARRLGFGLLLRFCTERGRFPGGRGELPDAAVEYVARQVGVPAAELAFYEWSGRTIEFHRSQTLTPEDRRALTPLFWTHVLPYGEVKLNMSSRLALGGGNEAAVPR
jgi:hypothetical protein